MQRHQAIKSLIIAALGLLGASRALADCGASATIKDVRRAHASGQKLEQSGDRSGALAAYVAAQEYTCEPNPVAADAARRAAALAKPLGDAARARGAHAEAYDFYERGGHFAEADRALGQWIAAQPDDPELYWKAHKHVEYRMLDAFRSNEQTRLAVTGPYTLDASLAARIKAMPEQGAQRALQAEATAFSEAFLQERVALIQARPDNPADFAAQQRWLARVQAAQARDSRDHLADSRAALERLRQWGVKSVNPGEPASFDRRRAERAQARVQALTQKFAGAPEMLEAAGDYVALVTLDHEAQQPQAAKIRRQAEQLGDAASARKRYQLAIDYYDVAGADDKAQRAREQLQAFARDQMQPTIDAMKRDAEALAAQFKDPARVEELKRQAAEAQRAVQQSQQQRNGAAARKSKDDLANELGL